MKRTKYIAVITLALFAYAQSSLAEAPAAQKPVTEQLVDTLTKLSSGPHKGFRSNHAKGIMASGTFLPTAQAATITKAVHLQPTSEPIPVTVRFSNATGLPTIADGDPNSRPKGMAIRFNIPGGGITDIVAISVNAFPASTPEDFLGLLNAVAESTPGKPSPTPIESFLGSHPAALSFVKLPKPAPASFASQAFFGVNAFEFTNAKNEVKYGRYRIIPEAQDTALSDDEAAKRPADYLIKELPGRLKTNPAKFKIAVQLANKDDEINDPAIIWPEDREIVELGTLTLDSVMENSQVVEKTIMFNPLTLPDGIAPTNDPVLLARPGAYAVSFGRRLAN
jgi:catalase